MEQILPILWHFAFGTGHGLVRGMRSGWLQVRAFKEFIRAVVVESVLAGLEALDHGMPGRMGVLAGVLVRRRVAAADVGVFGANAATTVPPACVPRNRFRWVLRPG